MFNQGNIIPNQQFRNYYSKQLLREKRLIFIDIPDAENIAPETNTDTTPPQREGVLKQLKEIFALTSEEKAERKAKEEAKAERESLPTRLKKRFGKNGRAERTIEKYKEKEETSKLQESGKEAKQNWKSEHPSLTRRAIGKLGIEEACENNKKAVKRITRNAVGKVTWIPKKVFGIGGKVITHIPKKMMAKHRESKSMNNQKKEIENAAKAKMGQDAKTAEIDAHEAKWNKKVVSTTEKRKQKQNRSKIPFFSLKHKPFTDKQWKKEA